MRHLIRAEVVKLSRATEYAKEISALSVGAQYGLAPEEIVDMSLNINVFGPPDGALERIRERLDALYAYPDIDLRVLKQSLAERHGLSPDAVLLGDGLDEVLKLIAQTFVEPGDRVIIPVPTFPRYQLEIEIMGGVSDLIPLAERFALPVDAILARVSARTKLIFVCAPNNPTGATVSREAIARLLDLGEEGPLIVVDEALIFPPEIGVTDWVRSHRNLMVLRTFSKFYGLAGARVGYALGDPELLTFMDIVRPPFNVNLLGEAAALGALSDAAFLDAVCASLAAERERLVAALAALPGVKVWPSETSIIMFDVRHTGWTSSQVTAALAKRGVVVVDCRSYVGLEETDFCRISVGSRRDNERLVDALQAVLTEPPGKV